MPIQDSRNLHVLWDMLLVGDASKVFPSEKSFDASKMDYSEERISTQGVFLGGCESEIFLLL